MNTNFDFENLSITQQELFLKQLDEAYYKKSKPLVSDNVYDYFKKLHLARTGKAQYEEVHDSLLEDAEKFTHTQEILSLDNIFTEEEVRRELSRLAPGIIQPKFDGLTVVYYPHDIAVTRGRGGIGNIITSTFKRIPDMGQPHDTYPIRLEALVNKTDFDALNSELEATGQETYESARNLAAGMLTRKDVNKVRAVTYFAYNIIGSSKTETEQLQELELLGYNVSPYFAFDKTNLEEAVQYVMSFGKESLPYDIDGLVIKSNLPDALAKFGKTGHHPKSAIAYKFPSIGAWTILKDVEWSVGREKVTPVGILEPVKVPGATVDRVTLHNIAIIRALNLSLGCEVYVARSGDTIPKVENSRNYNPICSIDEPVHCPSCGSSLEKDNDQLFCRNDNCKGRLHSALCHIKKREALDIAGLGEVTAQDLIDKLAIESVFDIFDLTKDQIKTLPGFAEKSASNLYNEIQKSRTLPLNRFLYSAGIVAFGRRASKEVAEKLHTYENVMEDIKNGCPQIGSIENIGPEIISALTAHVVRFEQLREYVEPIPVEEKKLTVKRNINMNTFVITGTHSVKREVLKEMIENAGHKTADAVSKNTNYLVAGEGAGSKLAKAEKLGVRVISEQELYDLLAS